MGDECLHSHSLHVPEFTVVQRQDDYHLCMGSVLIDRWLKKFQVAGRQTTPGQIGSDIGLSGGEEKRHFIHLANVKRFSSQSCLGNHQYHMSGHISVCAWHCCGFCTCVSAREEEKMINISSDLHVIKDKQSWICQLFLFHNNVFVTLRVKEGIRESVDSLCRDGADAQYMQYLSKSRITSLQTR